MKKQQINKKMINKKKINKKKIAIELILTGLFGIFIIVSFAAGFVPGQIIGENSSNFLLSMISIFPGAFILIGLFEVWIDRKIIERHLGSQSGLLGYFWVIILSCTIMGPLIISFPIAHSLAKKGARLQLVIAFLSAATISRIPMTVFEASYLGVPFSLVRLLVSIPLVIIFSEIIGRMFKKEEHKLTAVVE